MKQRGNFFVFVFVVIAFLQYQIVSFVSNSNNFFKLNIKKIFNNYIHTHTHTYRHIDVVNTCSRYL